MNYTKIIKQIETIYEDENLVVLTKPSGLLSIADRYKTLLNLKDILLKKYEFIYTVHRLDKETSGIMVFAKNEKTHKFLSDQFASKKVESIYWAFVQNKPNIESGIIDMPILNDIRKSGRMHINQDGKEALTKYKTLHNYGNICLMAFLPVTNRTHQIRIHSKYIGCPLLVDTVYSKKNNFYLSEVKRHYKKTQFEDEKPFIKRLTLHAKSISFKLPNGKQKTFESELPKDLRALKNQLDKLIKT